MPSIFTNHWSVSIGSTITPVRPERGTRSLYGFSETRRFCASQIGKNLLARRKAVEAVGSAVPSR